MSIAPAPTAEKNNVAAMMRAARLAASILSEYRLQPATQ